MHDKLPSISSYPEQGLNKEEKKIENYLKELATRNNEESQKKRKIEIAELEVCK